MPVASPRPRRAWRRWPSALAVTFVAAFAACDRDPMQPAAVPSAAVDAPARMQVRSVRYSQLDVIDWQNCALRTDGVVECWGWNDYGQAPASKSASVGTYTSVSVGGLHGCALRSDGVAECWGWQNDGAAPPIRPASTSGQYFTKLRVGYDHSCALLNTGAIECWGDGIGSGMAGIMNPSDAAQSFVDLDAGAGYACGLRGDGIIECWGDGVWRVGDVMTPSAAGEKFIALSAGSGELCALRTDGVVECAGRDFTGPTLTLHASTGALQYIAVGAGNGTNCAVRGDGVVECWGANAYGEGPAQRVPTTARLFFTSVGVGETHTCALRNDGVVECWGLNGLGQAPATRAVDAPFVTVNPTAEFRYTTVVEAGRSIKVSLMNAKVDGYPHPLTFTYAFDCGDGAGYGAFGTGNSTTCPTTAPGARTVKGKVQDPDGDVSEYTGTVKITSGYTFTGFEAPVDNPPLLNVAKAGRIIPIKWRLQDGHGTPVLTLTSHDAVLSVTALGCSSALPSSVVEDSDISGGSGLQNLGDGYYQVNWATPKSWGGTCKTLRLALPAGIVQEALFQFTK